MTKYTFPSHVDVHEFVTEKLSGSNYFMWKSKMLGLIRSHGLADFVKDTVSDSQMEEEEEDEDWKKIDGIIRRWILATVDDHNIFFLADMETARDMFKFLNEVHSQITFFDDMDLPPRSEGLYLSRYLPLAKAALHNDWDKAAKFLEDEPNAVRSIISFTAETALMIAVRSCQRMDFTQKLVAMMSPEDLALADEYGFNALHIAAQIGNLEAAKLLVDKNPRLLYAFDRRKMCLPLHYAADSGKKQMISYLISVTKENADFHPYHGQSGSKLLIMLIGSGFYDVALFLVKNYPESATFDPIPLLVLCLGCDELKSAPARLNFWQRIFYSLRQKLYRLSWNLAKKSVPQENVIPDVKVNHHQAQELLKQLVSEIMKLEYNEASDSLFDVFLMAAEYGAHEIVEHVLEILPTAIRARSDILEQSFLHLAISNRQEKVYNIIYQMDEVRYLFLTQLDQLENMPLHAAGSLEDKQMTRLRASATGAALQLQRELQWFKEVEKLTPPQVIMRRNSEGKTASLLFTETHKELVREAEKWVKDTSNSFTIVAALILTAVFAAAISVPGGNDSNTGLPFHAGQISFTVFAISDALALFSSTCSLLMFLSILTSQFSEADFLNALPKRLIIGLTTLFLSIILMMIAFSATVQILFGDLGSWVLVPLISLACVPITLFMTLQFSLLVDIIKSTYGPGIFGKQSDIILH